MDNPRHPRHHTIATIDAQIAQAEQLRSAQIVVLQGLTTAGHDTCRAAMLLQLTEKRLAQLQISRAHLAGAVAEEAAAASLGPGARHKKAI